MNTELQFALETHSYMNRFELYESIVVTYFYYHTHIIKGNEKENVKYQPIIYNKNK